MCALIFPMNNTGFSMLQTRVDSGLDGVIVADTVMSEVDGEAGRLVVRGHALEELVATRGYEAVAALLWDGYAAGGGGDADAVARGLGAARVRAFADVSKLLAATRGLTPIRRSASLCAWRSSCGVRRGKLCRSQNLPSASFA